jgi:hypothetical protein
MKPLGPESFSEATEQYREWLATKLVISNQAWKNRLKVVAKQAPFAFLRATFYRWSQWWPVVCDELTDAPYVLGVGDLHLENYGTWRDKEGRLVWGVNDVDECCCLPYTNDLVRLATSALFALLDMDTHTEDLIKDLNDDKRTRNNVLDKFKNTIPGLYPEFRSICAAILKGYSDTINPDCREVVRRPFVLAEKAEHVWLRDIMLNKLAAGSGKGEFEEFLSDLTKKLSGINVAMPQVVWQAIDESMPSPGLPFRVGTREAGLGSLGRQRFTAVLLDWQGGILAREAKALAPSAWGWWTDDRKNTTEILCQALLAHGVRAHDPWVRIYGDGQQCWVLRRLAPDSGKIRLKDLSHNNYSKDHLFSAMGHEAANIHVELGPVWDDLKKRMQNSDWLYRYSLKMADAVLDDWANL